MIAGFSKNKKRKKMCVKNDEIESEMGKSLIHTLK